VALGTLLLALAFRPAQIRFLLDPCTKVIGPTPGPPPASGLAFLCVVAGNGSSGPKLTADCDDQFGDFPAQFLRVAYACVAAGLGATPAPPKVPMSAAVAAFDFSNQVAHWAT
jgi:hypothetical protein